MIDVVASSDKPIRLGRLGENEHTRIVFDVSEYLATYPNASFSLLNRLPAQDAAYPVAEIETNEQYVYWTVASSALIYAGIGQCELVVRDGDVVAKSVIYTTEVLPALDDNGPVPEPWDGWLDRFEELAQNAADSASDSADSAAAAESYAEQAASRAFSIGVDGTTLTFIPPTE